MQEIFKTRLVAKVPRVADVVTFRFERPRDHSYQAGQWFNITFAKPHRFAWGGEMLTHHFSYSSAPTEPYLEFSTRMRGSEFKNALDRLPLGAEVECEGPYGGFTLATGGDRVAFIAGGIGITCVRSILRWLADGGTGAGMAVQAEGPPPPAPPVGELVVFHANRSETEIPFKEELGQMENVLPRMRTVYVISQPGGQWEGYRGHVDRQILAGELLGPEAWTYYVSGPPSMVEGTREMLVGWGISPEAIRTERFEGYE